MVKSPDDRPVPAAPLSAFEIVKRPDEIALDSVQICGVTIAGVLEAEDFVRDPVGVDALAELILAAVAWWHEVPDEADVDGQDKLARRLGAVVDRIVKLSSWKLRPLARAVVDPSGGDECSS